MHFCRQAEKSIWKKNVEMLLGTARVKTFLNLNFSHFLFLFTSSGLRIFLQFFTSSFTKITSKNRKMKSTKGTWFDLLTLAGAFYVLRISLLSYSSTFRREIDLGDELMANKISITTFMWEYFLCIKKEFLWLSEISWIGRLVNFLVFIGYTSCRMSRFIHKNGIHIFF